MPRDVNGDYTLPSGNPVVSGTTIASDWANGTMSDIRAALSDSLSRTGKGGMLVPFKNLDGTAADPSVVSNSYPATGLYWFAGDLRVSRAGVDKGRVVSEGMGSPNFTEDIKIGGGDGLQEQLSTQNSAIGQRARIIFHDNESAAVSASAGDVINLHVWNE